MARKKKGNAKANSRLSGIQEDMEHELQENALNGHQQLLSLLSGSVLAYSSPENQLATALEGKGRNRGKGRADPRESTSHDSSIYQPSYQQFYEEDSLALQRQYQPGTSSPSIVPYPLPDLSRDGPSGGFFEGSSGIEIKGGKFNQTYGHHTNVTIHLNQPREEDNLPQQHLQPSLAPPFISPSQGSSHNIVSPPTQDIHRAQFASMPIYEQCPSTPLHNITPPPMQDIHVGQFPLMDVYEQGPSISTMIYAPDNSNKIYERHLGLKQRGFPLWIPEPNRRLPMPYRRKGVHVGDVGIVTPSGAFSFLFNICLPPDHPINPRTLPEGFAPIYPPIEAMDIREYSEFKPESYLASTAIEKTNNDPLFRGLSFVTSAAEGAVLTLPDGAIALDLENIPRFRAYAAKNIESWYRYINGPRGREAKNGEVRLVIGCDKATSWGMAAVANMTQHKAHYLKYRSVMPSIADGGATPAPIPLYKWEYTGLGEARVGPDLPEIAELKRNDESNVAVEGKYWNQCLFMRTLNLTLSEEVFAAITREVEAALVLESQQFQNKEASSNSINGNSPSPDAQTGNGQQSGTSSTNHTGSTNESSGSATENLAALKVVSQRVTTTRSPSAPKSHPADALNRILLRKIPNCRVVITQDEDWCSVIKEDDEIMPSPSEIAERVLAAHYIREEEGVVFLEPKMERQSALHHRQIRSKQSIQDETGSQSHMAGSSRPTVTSSTSLASRGSELAWRPPSRTGTLNTSAALSTSSDIIHLQTVSDPELLTSPGESVRDQNMGHARSRTAQRLEFSANYRWPFAVLAVISLLIQVMQLSPRHTAFWQILEISITLVFDVEIALAIFDDSPTWLPFLHPVETRINLISAVVSTVSLLPIIRRSRLYPWLSFSQILRMHRVPIAIPRMRRFLIAFSGHLYLRLNISLFLVIGNAVGVVYFLRNVTGSDSFGPKLPKISAGDLVAVFCGGLCLVISNVFVYNVFHAITLGKIEAVDQQPPIPSRVHDLRPELQRSRFLTFIENLRQRFRGITNTQDLPIYNLVGNSDESLMHSFSRDPMRSDPLGDTLTMRTIYSIRTFCRRLVKPPHRERIFWVPPSPMLQLLFEAYIILAIIANIIVSCVATPSYRSQHPEPILDTWFGKADLVFVSSLLVEFTVKILADGFFAMPNGYFSSVRNWVDFLVLLGNVYNLAASLASTNSIGTFSRALRALSVLRFITISQRMRKTVTIIFNSIASHAFDATVLAILYVLPYGLWNVNIFSSGLEDAIESSELNFALFNFMPCIFLMALLISALEHISLSTADIYVSKSKRDWKKLRTYLTRQVFNSRRLPIQQREGMTILLRPFQTHIWTTIVKLCLVAIVVLFMLKSSDLALHNDPSGIIAAAYFLATVPPVIDVFVRSYTWRSARFFIFDILTAIGNFGSTLVAFYLYKDRPVNGLLLQGVFIPGTIFKLFKLFYPRPVFKPFRPKNGLKMFMGVISSSYSTLFGFLGLWFILLTFNIILVLEVFGLPQLYMEAPLGINIGHIAAMFTLWGSGKNWNQYIASCDLQSIPSFPLRGCNSQAWVYTLFISWTFTNSFISVQAFTCVIAERFSHFSQFFGKLPDVISTTDIEIINRLWSEFCNHEGRLEWHRLFVFLSKLHGAFEVRCYPEQYSIQNIMALSRHVGVSTASSQIIAAIDLTKLSCALRGIDPDEIKRRKRLYAGIYYEAILQTDMLNGISFTQMLMMLSYHKFVIDKSQSLSVQELVERSAIDEKVHDLIALDRVKSLLKMVVCRRRFLKYSLGRREYAKKESDPLPSLLYIPEDVVKSSKSKLHASSKNRGSQPFVSIHSPPVENDQDGSIAKDLDLIDVLFPSATNDPKTISSNKKIPSDHLPSYVGSNIDTQ